MCCAIQITHNRAVLRRKQRLVTEFCALGAGSSATSSGAAPLSVVEMNRRNASIARPWRIACRGFMEADSARIVPCVEDIKSTAVVRRVKIAKAGRPQEQWTGKRNTSSLTLVTSERKSGAPPTQRSLPSLVSCCVSCGTHVVSTRCHCSTKVSELVGKWCSWWPHREIYVWRMAFHMLLSAACLSSKYV